MLFRSGGSPTVSISIDVSGLNSGDVVKLQLEYAGPPELSGFVRIGGGNTSTEITITLGENAIIISSKHAIVSSQSKSHVQ